MDKPDRCQQLLLGDFLQVRAAPHRNGNAVHIFAKPEHLLDDNLTDQRPRQSLWAKLDHLDQHPDGYTTALFDSVDADWLDGESGKQGQFAHPDAGEHVSILTLAARPGAFRQQWYRIELEAGRTAAPFRAYEVDLSAGDVALQADSLLGLSTPRRLLSLRAASKAEAAKLGSAGSMASVPDAAEKELNDLLRGIRPTTSIAVLDVGQGNWNALLTNGVPTLLFDIGGGVLAHLSSFPPKFAKFCFAAAPPVILSHWDWDHWSSAVRFPDAQELTWVVPRQGSLGPTHATFLAALRARGTVLAYPPAAALPGRQVGPPSLRLQQAIGAASSRNATGLALLSSEPEGQRIALLPGDAGYANLELPDALTSIVVPHHGGVTRSTASNIPRFDRAACGRAVISVGSTSKKHPSEASVRLHKSWASKLLITSKRIFAADEPAHVELHWSSAAIPTPACCSDSALPLSQR